MYRCTCCVRNIVQLERRLHRPFLTRQLRHFMVQPASNNTPQTGKIDSSFYKKIKEVMVLSRSAHTAISLTTMNVNGAAAAVTGMENKSVTQAAMIHTCRDTAEDKSEATDTSSSDSSEEIAHDLPNTGEEKENIPSLQARALSFLVLVDIKHLTPAQRAIHDAHLCALQAGDDFYTDPSTGYQVMSRIAHLRRGDCCGNACRHCPYGQKSAPEHLRRPYNSAFYD